MTSLFNLSFRYKIPLWGSVLIVAGALAVAGALMLRAYDDLKEDLLISSAALGRTLAVTLFPVMLHDDAWRAFELISAPLKDVAPDSPIRAEMILVLDNTQHVYATTHPRSVPMLAELRRLSAEHAALAERLGVLAGTGTATIEPPGAKHLYVVTPIVHNELRLGTLIIAHSKRVFMPRFWGAAWRGGLVGLLVLAVLLPINWYWGQRMAVPLVLLASRMSDIGRRRIPPDLDARLYGYQDELGRLFESYNRMLAELNEKQELERQMLQSERLAAVGRLAAGMAHEINNPLGGMLTALDTLKCHGELDPRTLKTVALIERGLAQIRDTVGALLVEARMKSRDLLPQDIEDVRTLVAPQAHKKALCLEWGNGLQDPVALPATLVRQILINLTLNAVAAAAEGGQVACEIGFEPGTLQLTVTNDGKLLSAEQMEHLFEPFSPLSEGGHGLGLWVTYQIVQQLGGRISAERRDERMRFAVRLPTGDEAWKREAIASA